MSDPMDEDALRASLFAIFGMSRTDEDLAIQRASMDYHYSGGQNLGTAPNPIPPHPSSPTAAHNPHHNVASQGHQHKPNMMDLLKTTKFEKEALEKEAEEITVDAPAKFHVTVKSTFSTDFEIVVGFSDGTIHLVKFDGTVHRRWDPSIGKRGKIGYDFASSLVLAPNTVFYGSNNHVLGLQTTFRE